MSSHVETKLVATNNTWYVTGTATQTVTLDSAPTDGDIVIAWCHQNTNATITNLAALGFSNVIVNVQGSGYSRCVAWKVASSEGTSYGFTTDATSTGNDGFAAVSVYSGVAASPLDSSYVDETVTSTSTTNFAVADVSTKATNTRVVALVFGGVGSGGPPSMTPPTGYTERIDSGVSNGPWGSIADKNEAAPGNKSPGQFTQSASGTGITYVLTLRDSAATYIEQDSVTWNPPTGYSYVEYKGDVIPENSILHLYRGTHTGVSGSATLTDSGVTLTADEWKDYRVTNWTDNDSAGIIGTHSAGSGPLTLSTGLSGGVDNDFDNGDSYDITQPMDNGDQIGYESTSTSTAGVYAFDYYLIDATDGVSTSDAVASVTATGLAANKTGNISVDDVGESTFAITGDAAGSGGMSAILGDNVLGDNVLGDISSPSSGPSVALSGTITTATEADIRTGGETIILTLTDDTWVASGTTFDAQRQHIIDGLDAATSPTSGWNNEVRDKAPVTDVVRTSDTVVTITLSAQSGYDISAAETITATVPSSALVTSGFPIVASPTFDIIVVPSASLSGTLVNADWTLLRDTGGTIVINLTNDTFIAAGTGPIGTTAQSDAFVQSFVAATSPTNGWNNEISLDNTDLARTSDTVATITVPATATYDPQITETISGTVQAAILTTYGSDIGTNSMKINVQSGRRNWLYFGGPGRRR